MIEVRLLSSFSMSLCRFYSQKQATACLYANILQAILLQMPASTSLKSPLNFMAVVFLPSIWLFPITMETFLSVGFCFTAKTACLRKLVGNLYVFQLIFLCRRQGSKKKKPEIGDDSEKKRIIF